MSNWPPKILTREETIEHIERTGSSFSRFGDGELSMMLMMPVSGFQRISFKLRRELINVARAKEDGFLVCIPGPIIDDSYYTDLAKKWWQNNIKKWGWAWKHYFAEGKVYGDTEITRPWIDVQKEDIAELSFTRIKALWNDRDVVMVEGERSRVGVGNDLLDNARSVRRIICPSKSAYSYIDEIEKECRKLPKDTLFLSALGMTATCLSYRLFKAGYQSYDIGHMDVELEWYRMRTTKKVPIKGKFVCEAGGNRSFKEMEIDRKYTDEIIARVGV